MHTWFNFQGTSPAAADDTTVAGRYVRAGLVAGACAAVANVVVVAVARQADVPMQVQDKEIPLLAFAQLTLIAAVLAVGFAAALSRWARRPRSTFVTLTVALAALTLIPPVLVDASTATSVVLEITHLLAALVIIPAVASRLARVR